MDVIINDICISKERVALCLTEPNENKLYRNIALNS